MNSTQWNIEEECAALFRRPISTVHNITFGLVTAVVTFQLGEVTTRSSGLYEHFQPIKTTREKKRRRDARESPGLGFGLSRKTSDCWDSFWFQAIILSPRVFVVMWISCGLVCLIVGSILGPERSGPIYTTGQTWLGFSITTTYTYFGIDSKKDSNDDSKSGSDNPGCPNCDIETSVNDSNDIEDNDGFDSGGDDTSQRTNRQFERQHHW